MTLKRQPIMQAGIFFHKEDAFPPGTLLLTGENVAVMDLQEMTDYPWVEYHDIEPGQTVVYMGISMKDFYEGYSPKDGGPEHLILYKNKLYVLDSGDFAEIKT